MKRWGAFFICGAGILAVRAIRRVVSKAARDELRGS